MSLVTLAGVAKSHGAQHLFDGVDLQVAAGRRIAVVGPNGAGKTTLLEIITGDQQSDAGTVTRARDLVIGYLPQEIAESRGRAALAEVLAGAGAVTGIERRMRHIETEMADATEEDELAELMDEYGRLQHRFEALGGYGLEAEARRILAGLGFAEADMERNTAEFSGGWMMRIALARLLLQNPDLLLLDEPTNHLDLASVEWLQAFLADYAGAILLVSHDRDFINAVVNRVAELHAGSLTEYVGDYADFVEQRDERIAQLERQAAAQGRKIAQVERFIERFRYKATKARQVQSRIKALDRMERVAAPSRRSKSVKFRFPEPPRSGRTVITLRDIVKGYGRHTVYDGLDLVLERGQKVALIGPNGAGKSTLLKILAGTLEFEGGTRQLGSNVKVAYFAQHQIDALNPANTVYDELAGAAERMTSSEIRALLGAFLFSGEAVEKRVEVLSGGEQTRLALAKLMADPANLLCLDEPTNHLDITQPRRAGGCAERLPRHDRADHPRPLPHPQRGQRDHRGERRQRDPVQRRLRVLRRQAWTGHRDARCGRGAGDTARDRDQQLHLAASRRRKPRPASGLKPRPATDATGALATCAPAWRRWRPMPRPPKTRWRQAAHCWPTRPPMPMARRSDS